MKESKTVHLFTEATMRQHKMTVYNTSLKHIYCDFQTSACSYVITMARSKENGPGKHAKYKSSTIDASPDKCTFSSSENLSVDS